MSTDNFQWTDELVKEFANNLEVDIIANDGDLDRFKSSKQPDTKEKEIIKVESILFVGDNEKNDFRYEIKYNKPVIGVCGYKLSSAIESVLNKDTVVERGIQDEFDGERIYLKSEVDTIRREEGLYWFREGYKYSRSFTSKIPYDEIAELTVVNAFNEISSLNSKEDKPSPSVNDEWEILSFSFKGLNGKLVICDNTGNYYHTAIKEPSKHTINSVLRKSDGKVFSVGDELDFKWKSIYVQGSKKIKSFSIEGKYLYVNGDDWVILLSTAKKLSPETPPIVKDRVQTSIELMKHYCKSIQFIFDNAGDKNPFIVLEEIRCAERNYEIAKQKLSQ